MKDWPTNLYDQQGEWSPRHIQSLYDAGFAGTVDDPEAEERFNDRAEYVTYGDACDALNLWCSRVDEGLYLPFLAVIACEAKRLGIEGSIADLSRDDRIYPWDEKQRTGDCTLSTAEVQLADGSRLPISQIKVGHRVVSAYSRNRSVTRVIKKPYSGEMVEITAKGRRAPLVLTPDHLVVTGEDVSLWKPASEIQPGDQILLPRGVDESQVSIKEFDIADYCPKEAITDEVLPGKPSRRSIPPKGYVRSLGCKHPVKRYVKLEEDLAWLLGLFAAEGSLERQDDKPIRVTYNIGSHRYRHARMICDKIYAIFGVSCQMYSVPSKKSVIYVRIPSAIVAEFFASLVPGNTYSKRAPACLMNSPESVRRAFIRGWFDGDGSRKGVGVTVSEALMDDLTALANSCGINWHVRVVPERGASKQHSRCYINKYNLAILYRGGRLPEAASGSVAVAEYAEPSGDSFAEVTSVRRVNLADIEGVDQDHVYCLEVAEDESFIADGYAVHNCVSHWARNHADCVRACEIIDGGEWEEWIVRTATEPIYGHRGHAGQGANCARLAEYLTDVGGMMLRKEYDIPEVGRLDLSQYTPEIGIRWGSSGVPQAVRTEGQKHQIRKAARITTAEEAIQAYRNGLAVGGCSGIAYSSTRNEDGVANVQGTWAHAMFGGGLDERPETIRKYGGRLFLDINSWGEYNSGPRQIRDTDFWIPKGACWVREKDYVNRKINGGGCFVLAGANGWKLSRLPDWGMLVLTKKGW